MRRYQRMPSTPHHAVTEPLRQAGIEFVVKRHEEIVLRSDLVAEQRGVRLSQIVKCMVACTEAGELAVLLIPGDRTLKLRKVRKFMGGAALTLMDPAQLERDHEVTVGAISPVQFHGKALILMDPTVLDEEMVDISSGDPTAGIELRSTDLRAFLGAHVADVVSAKSQSDGRLPTGHRRGLRFS